MSIFDRLRLLFFGYLSKPVADRPVYRAIRRLGAAKIVEVGIGDARRALRMIEVAKQAGAQREVHYVGFDPFEGATVGTGPSLSLKSAHQLLRATGAKVQLVPGDPAETLIRMANALGKVDVLIVPGELDSPSMDRVWFFVPRMLDERSLVFIDGPAPDGQRVLRLKPRHEIEARAAAVSRRRAA